MWPPDLGDGRHDLPGHSEAFGGLAPCHVLAGEPKERRQCPRSAEGAGIGQLQDGLDLVAQVPASDGAAGPGSAERNRGGGRNVLGRFGGGRPRPENGAEVIDSHRRPRRRVRHWADSHEADSGCIRRQSHALFWRKPSSRAAPSTPTGGSAMPRPRAKATLIASRFSKAKRNRHRN